MKEWKIGEIRNGIICQVGIEGTCEGCMYEEMINVRGGGVSSKCVKPGGIKCDEREDGEVVIFKKVVK